MAAVSERRSMRVRLRIYDGGTMRSFIKESPSTVDDAYSMILRRNADNKKEAQSYCISTGQRADHQFWRNIVLAIESTDGSYDDLDIEKGATV